MGELNGLIEVLSTELRQIILPEAISLRGRNIGPTPAPVLEGWKEKCTYWDSLKALSFVPKDASNEVSLLDES